jgi:polar amino acid transport system ATP-binding protein
MVEFRDVHKSFGHTSVLRGFDLSISAGEKVALIGRSGSGKTTLLRLLMTLEQPDSGEVRVDGELLWHKELDGKRIAADEKHLRKMRGKIGMVFQQFNLFPHMNALRNVTEAPIHVLGIAREEAEEQARSLLDLVGLGEKLRAYPSELSGGQQQRVAIARALAMRPSIMLFDEVTSALDPELIGEVLNVIRRLARETQMTMLVVTHEMGFARDISGEVVFVDNGKVVEKGPPEVVLTNPSKAETRAFLKAVLER